MDWISVEDRLPDWHCIVYTKTKNEKEEKSYFHADRMAWLSFYSKDKLSHFQSCETLKFLHDVTHWRSNLIK